MKELLPKLRNSIKFDHLYALTDHNGVLQHAEFSVPSKRKGYALDDNARALVLASKARSLFPSHRLEGLSEFQRKTLAFILLMQSEDGRFHNLMDFSQRITDDASVGDHLGRAIWSAGAVINSDLPSGMKNSARRIFDRALPWGRTTNSLRTLAYASLGLGERLHSEQSDRNLILNQEEFARKLLQEFEKNSSKGWNWFEDKLTYDNARLSQALFVAYQAIGESEILATAEQSLQFLLSVTTKDGMHVPIGNRGWYTRGGEPAQYDQQPVDVGAIIETTALAYKLTGNDIYEKAFRRALGWFFGLNTKSLEVYDPSTGACFDGITPAGINENQGAESTIAFLLGVVTAIENFGET